MSLVYTSVIKLLLPTLSTCTRPSCCLFSKPGDSFAARNCGCGRNGEVGGARVEAHALSACLTSLIDLSLIHQRPPRHFLSLWPRRRLQILRRALRICDRECRAHRGIVRVRPIDQDPVAPREEGRVSLLSLAGRDIPRPWETVGSILCARCCARCCAPWLLFGLLGWLPEASRGIVVGMTGRFRWRLAWSLGARKTMSSACRCLWSGRRPERGDRSGHRVICAVSPSMARRLWCCQLGSHQLERRSLIQVQLVWSHHCCKCKACWIASGKGRKEQVW